MTYNDTNSIAPWKRPWSLDEIINSSQCWSLAADSGVCELLKSFSTDLLNEIAQLNNNVNELSTEFRQTNVVIQNAFNDFCMLANNQFMENLVEDASSCQIPNGISKEDGDLVQNKEDKLAEIIPQVTETLKLGMQVLESQFEILDMHRRTSASSPTHEESEAETPVVNSPLSGYLHNEPIYHPRDPYENRHLPHLIGTAAFVEDDTLGIGFIDDMEELQDASVDSDHSHQSADGDDDLSSLSSFESDLNADQRRPADRQRPSDNIFGGNSVSDSDEDMFASTSVAAAMATTAAANAANYQSVTGPGYDSDSFNDNDKLSQEPPVKPVTLQDQLHDQLKRKLGLVTVEPASEEAADNNLSHKSEPHKVSPNSPALLHNRDREGVSSTNNAQFIKQSTNLARRTFLDSADDDDDDLFAAVVVPAASKDKKVAEAHNKPFSHSPSVPDARPKEDQRVGQDGPVRPSVKVQSDSDDELFSSRLTKLPVKISASPNVAPKRKSPIKFLDSDTDDDLFAPKPQQKPVDKSQAISRGATVPAKATEPDKKLEKQAATVRRPYYSLLNDDDDDDDDDGLFKIPIVTSQAPPTNQVKAVEVNKVTEDVSKDMVESRNELIGPLSIPNLPVVEKSRESDEDLLFSGSPSRKSDRLKPLTDEKVVVDVKKAENIAKPVDKERTTATTAASKDHKKATDIDSDDSGDDLFNFSKPPPVSLKRSIVANDIEKNNFGPMMQNSNNNVREMVVDVDPLSPETEVPHKLPAGAVNPIGKQSSAKHGMSIIDEMKSRNLKSKPSTFPIQEDIDELDSEPVPESNFRERLQRSLSNARPPDILISTRSEPTPEREITFEEPPQEIRQLNLLTKARARNIPRRRPTGKKAELDNETGGLSVSDKERRPVVTTSVPTVLSTALPTPVAAASIATELQPSTEAAGGDDAVADIFANLPSRRPAKKTKSSKKSSQQSTKSAAKSTAVGEIDDIFAVPTSKPSAKKTKAKPKSIDDPLGAFE